MAWPIASGQTSNTTGYASLVGDQHIYLIIGLAIPCVFIIAFGAYISHFQGRCDGVLRLFCPCLPTIWESNQRRPRPREMDAIVVLSTIDRHKFKKKRELNPEELACVVVMPDKSCQVAWQTSGMAEKESRIEGNTVVFLQATVAGSPLPNSAFSSPEHQHLISCRPPNEGDVVVS